MLRFITMRAARAATVAKVLAAPPLAQSAGRIVGRVTDDRGAVVSGAQIISSPSGLSAVSREDGRYTIASVPAGTESLRAFRLGF